MFDRRKFIAGLDAALLAAAIGPSALGVSPGKSPDVRANRRGLVIIAPRQFEGALKPHVEHKRQDLPVEFVTLDHVLADTQGVDDPERVKRFLYRAWKERSARYVLLVGDVSMFPTRYFAFDRITPAAHDTAFDPSDLYYADVAKADGSFEDWQAHKEGHHRLYFGEIHGEKIKTDPINFDRINYRPKLAVGRWPATTPGELKIIVAKTIAFDQRLKAGRKRPPQAGMVAAEGWIDVRGQLDQLAAPMAKKWRVHKR